MHNEHYKTKDIEPILVMEQIMSLPLDRVVALNLAMATKHIMRAGSKKDNDSVKEIEKAINYLTRAKTGAWV